MRSRIFAKFFATCQKIHFYSKFWPELRVGISSWNNLSNGAHIFTLKVVVVEKFLVEVNFCRTFWGKKNRTAEFSRGSSGWTSAFLGDWPPSASRSRSYNTFPSLFFSKIFTNFSEKNSITKNFDASIFFRKKYFCGFFICKFSMSKNVLGYIFSVHNASYWHYLSTRILKITQLRLLW